RGLRTLYEHLLPGSQYADRWTHSFDSGSTGAFIAMPREPTDESGQLEGAATRVETLPEP
ncbi:MAG: hypothetical protein AAF645_18370, partial [Myxococcota bacterium]